LANEPGLGIFSIDLKTEQEKLPLKIGGEINIDYGKVELEVIGFESEETYLKRLGQYEMCHVKGSHMELT